MVIDLPLVNDNVTNSDRYAQGLMGRCCGYGKKDHSVKVISSLRHASQYSKWYRFGIPPTRPSAKTTHSSEGTTSKPSSAYDAIGLGPDAKPSADDDEEPVDSAVDALQDMHVSHLDPATTAVKDEDYASDSGDDVIQHDDEEFYDSLVVDWTYRSATFKASLKPVSGATMAVATQMMKDVLEEEE